MSNEPKPNAWSNEESRTACAARNGVHAAQVARYAHGGERRKTSCARAPRQASSASVALAVPIQRAYAHEGKRTAMVGAAAERERAARCAQRTMQTRINGVTRRKGSALRAPAGGALRYAH